MFYRVIDSTGRVIVPKALRDELGFVEGQEVAFEKGEDGSIILRRTQADEEREKEIVREFLKKQGKLEEVRELGVEL